MTETSKKTTTKKKDSLDAALLRAQINIGAVQKDSKNAHHRYEYVSAENMIQEARRVLHDQGILVREKDVDFTDTGTGIFLVTATFQVSHPASGESFADTLSLPACPGKGRPEDKAALASLTTIISYYLRGLLMIPRVDEEICARDDSNYTGKEVAEKIEKIKKTGNKPEPKTKVSPQQVTTLRNLCKSKKTPEARSSFKDEMYRFLGLDKDAPIEDAPAVAAEHFIQHSTNDNLPI